MADQIECSVYSSEIALMSWFRRKRFGSSEQARMLHQILAIENYGPLSADNFDVPVSSIIAFNKRVRLYREALVLLALVEKADVHSLILRSYEKIIFGTDPDDAGAYRRMIQTKDAMRELADIMFSNGENPGLYWTRSWMAEVGYDETNPATLSLFAICWMDLFIAARASLVDLVGEE